MRPARLWAVARQDWATELAGRQGLLLPGLLLGLLAGPALSPKFEFGTRGWRAEGDVPAVVAGLPQDPQGAVLGFRDGPAGLVVSGDPPPEVRAALDGPTPVVDVISSAQLPRLPGRTALFGLISASTLSGAVAASIGGERSRKTLGVLLSAAISRTELVVGKALAWASFGLGSMALAAAVSLALGRVEAGWWLVPLTTLPLATVSLGFWLVRRATDVVAGTATSMRVLPAVVAVSGVVASVLGLKHPVLGALIPVGGALVASGGAWPGATAALVATAATLAFSAAMLALTIRDLEEFPGADDGGSPLREWALVTSLAATCWWIAVGTPVLYTLAGNAGVIERIPTSTGVWAGAACLVVGSVLHLARVPDATLPIAVPPWWAWPGALAAAAVSFAVHRAPLAPWGMTLLADRMHLAGAWAGAAGFVAAAADEVLFRGWLPGRVGRVGAVAAWVLVKAPLDPLGALIEGVVLTLLAERSGSVWPGMVARFLALSLA